MPPSCTAIFHLTIQKTPEPTNGLGLSLPPTCHPRVLVVGCSTPTSSYPSTWPATRHAAGQPGFGASIALVTSPSSPPAATLAIPATATLASTAAAYDGALSSAALNAVSAASTAAAVPIATSFTTSFAATLPATTLPTATLTATTHPTAALTAPTIPAAALTATAITTSAPAATITRRYLVGGAANLGPQRHLCGCICWLGAWRQSLRRQLDGCLLCITGCGDTGALEGSRLDWWAPRGVVAASWRGAAAVGWQLPER